MPPAPTIEVMVEPKVSKAVLLLLFAVGVVLAAFAYWDPEASFFRRRGVFLVALVATLASIHQALFALGRTRLMVTLEGVRAELQVPFFGAMVWEEPLDAYGGVLPVAQAEGGAKLVLTHKALTYQIRNVTLAHHEGEGGEAAAEALATQFDLPVLDKAVGIENLTTPTDGEEAEPAPAAPAAPFPPGPLQLGEAGARLMIDRPGRIRAALFAAGGSALGVIGVLAVTLIAPAVIPKGWLFPVLGVPALGFVVAVLCVLRFRFKHEQLVLEGGRLKRYQAKIGLLLLREELDARRIMAVGCVSPGPGEEGYALRIQNGAQDLVIFRGTPRPEQLRWVADTLGARLGCEG